VHASCCTGQLYYNTWITNRSRSREINVSSILKLNTSPSQHFTADPCAIKPLGSALLLFRWYWSTKSVDMNLLKN
jgi:hypothetical protein